MCIRYLITSRTKNKARTVNDKRETTRKILTRKNHKTIFWTLIKKLDSI